MASAVVPDSVSTPVADVLVPILAPPASPVVLILDETAVALHPVLVDVFATETVVVAAVVSGPAVWVHHVWSAHRGRLLGVVSSNPYQHLSHLSLCG